MEAQKNNNSKQNPHNSCSVCLAAATNGIGKIEVYVSWMLRQCPSAVARAVLLDPVVILLNLPSVCYNFVYRVPRSMIEASLHYFASRELHISKSMSRHFHWIQNIVWSEDISVPTLVVLSEKDSITNAPAIRRYLERSNNPNIDLVWLSGLNHAEFLFKPSITNRVVARVALAPTSSSSTCTEF